MDAYPAYSLTQNIPLLVTVGLPPSSSSKDGDGDDAWTLDTNLKEQATLLRSDLPVLDGDHAAEFSRYITSGDVSGPVPVGSQSWRGRASSQRYRFRVRTAGRTYYFPPRHARLPETYDAPDLQQITLHSPFSPLSPSCALYPDGIINAQWIRKHQEVVPSVFLCCHTLTPDSTTATLQDNKIKSDISAFRSAVQQSGYRSRVAVAVFVAAGDADDHTGTAADSVVQERLESIRKTTNTEAKLFFAVPTTSSGASLDELHRVAENMLTNIYTVAMDYYRELSRHVRKKRGRGSAPQPSVPPTSGTSQTLSLAGWHIRYDFKAAVLAEFRQETDVALRLLEQAYEMLLGPEVLYEAIPHWSPRWNEARLLADMLAIRSLRCLLMAGQYSGAVRRWTAHRDRLRALLEARGRGTTNYGWPAWEAQWAVVMADLIQRIGVPGLSTNSKKNNLYLLPEKAMLAERLAPWEYLHHRGYWFRMAARHTAARRTLAQAIPEEDRQPPGISPASTVAHRAFAYDDYMCPPPHEEFPLPESHGPGVDHSAVIVAYLERGIGEFLRHRQTRAAAELALECGREYVASKQWQAAVDRLAPLWTGAAWAMWPGIHEELAWTLRAAAQNVEPRRTDLLVAIDWELQSAKYSQRANWPYDVRGSVADSGGDASAVQLDTPPSFLSVAFVFKNAEGKAGEVAQAQVVLRSNALAKAAPIVFDELRVRFSGNLKPIVIKHRQLGEAKPKGGVSYSEVQLAEEGNDEDGRGANEADKEGDDDDDASNLCGTADLTLHPQSTLVFRVAIPLRQPGDARALSADLKYSCPAYSLQLAAPLVSDVGGGPAWYLAPRANARVAVPRADSQAIHVLSRPPKLDIKLVGTDELVPTSPLSYYTNEAIDLALELINGEDSDASVKLDVLMEGDDDGTPGFTLLVGGEEIDTAAASAELSSNDASSSALRSVPLGRVIAGTSVGISLRMPPSATPANLEITLRAVYHLVTDTATPITQQLAIKVNLSNPFEANYDLLPRLHPAPWPSLFDHEGIVAAGDAGGATNTVPRGLTQAWALVTRYASFAAEDLCIVDLGLVIKPMPTVVVQHSRRRDGDEKGAKDERDANEANRKDGTTAAIIRPQTMEEAQFNLVVQKLSLDDRDAVHLDVSFVIAWRRLSAGEGDDAPVNKTVLPVPRLALFGSEPRVLASVAYSRARTQTFTTMTLKVAIENPSTHFLTFGLVMEPASTFAFSGAKLTTMHVLPMSRRTATYRLVPLTTGPPGGGEESAGNGWWIRPGLVVRDKYFQKVLRILPTEGMKMDKDGILVWVPPPDDDDEESGNEGEDDDDEEDDEKDADEKT